MPTTVTASNSVAYHLWQLPDLTTPEPEDSIEYAVLDNPLTDGYRASVQTGFDAGTKTWKLTLPTLASYDVLANTVTDINGATVSREQYLRALYAENKVTGQPFVFQDPQSGTYYFVDFADEALTLSRMRVKLFTTGITLKQRRLPGVTLP